MSGCLCNNPGDIRYLSINGQRTGTSGLLDIFETWIVEKKQPEDLSPAVILEAVRRYNYVSESVKDQYIKAMRSEYREYIKGKSKDEKGPSPP